jgi:PAS domain S-box-containing protein
MALLGGDKGNVQLLGDDGVLRIAAQEGFEQDFLDFFAEVSAEDFSACGRALRAAERVVVEDLEADEEYALMRPIARRAGYRAVQSTPMINREGRRLGMISTHFRVPHRPSEQSLRLLDLYVRQAVDFIDRCNAEQQLRASERRLKALSDIAPGTILWVTEPDGACSFISRGWYEYTGQRDGQALGSGWLEPIHAPDREPTRRFLAAANDKQEPFVIDCRLRRADGEVRWVLAASRPRHDEGGRFLGFVGSIIDVHERKLAENLLRQSEAMLKEANRRKDEFLAVLGHELRNPLAPLSVAADLLQQAEQKPALLETVRPMMRRQIDHLTRLVDDLLDVSRISRGHAELQRAPLDLRTAVENAVEQSRPLIAARKHDLRVELGDIPLRVDGDFQRLTQVFVNLLSNAAKYSEPAGKIAVRAVQEGAAAVVRVTDAGFGIPKERVVEVFEMFSQVPEHRPLVGGGGLGIGLALCRQLVELHGGSIEAASEGLGRGSEFAVRLPLVAAARTEARTPTDAPAVSAERRGVLIVDDNADAAATLRMALELQGHDARAAFSGTAALEAMHERHAEVVLLDLGMPLMDGFEVARRIRALPGGRDVLLVALTGWGQDQDRARTAEAGFDEHLTKPVDAALLSAILAVRTPRHDNLPRNSRDAGTRSAPNPLI